jgi:hypothetical protein
LLKQVEAELGIDIPPKQSWAKLVLIALKRYSVALKRFTTRGRGMAMVGVAFSLGNTGLFFLIKETASREFFGC